MIKAPNFVRMVISIYYGTTAYISRYLATENLTSVVGARHILDFKMATPPRQPEIGDIFGSQGAGHSWL